MAYLRIARFRYTPVRPYSFELTVRKPAGWSWSTPHEIWETRTLWSGIWFKASIGARRRKIPLGIKARASDGGVVVDVFSACGLSPQDLARLRAGLGRALGANEDLRPFYRLLRAHPMLRRLARRLHGMHEGWGMDVFSSLTLAILLQMAPIKRSETMWDCLLRRHGRRISFDGRSVVLWPDERTIARLSPRELARECRLGYRAKFLVRLARQMLEGFPDVEELARMRPEEAQARLKELFGVGDYTAGFASPHPSFVLDVWSIKIFHPILFGRPAPAGDPRSAIPRAARAAEKMWGEWRGYVLVYVLNDLPHLARAFNIPIS
jgi:3-methyladenine DNA glycosylase/8-oxoguanine DNA glycosylase